MSNRTFIFGLSPAYSGLKDSIVYKIVDTADSIFVAQTTPGSGGVLEDTNGGISTGQYYVNRSNWNEGFAGRISWIELTNQITYTEQINPVATSGQLATILTNNDPAFQNVANSLGKLTRMSNNTFIEGYISDNSSAINSFNVTLTTGVFPGQTGAYGNICGFTSGTLEGYKSQCTGFTPGVNNQNGTLTFLLPFGSVPASGDTVIIF